MRRVMLVLVILLLAPGVALAGGGGVDTSACAGYGEGTDISMQDSCFSGTAHFAPSDTAITVTNNGFMPHSLTAVDGSFDTGLLEAGVTADLSVSEPGIYQVFCTLHGTAAGEGMAGVLIVGEAVPASMAAPLDVSSFETTVEEKVVAGSEAIRQAMENQGRTMGEIRSVQADMATALERLAPAEGATAVAVPDDSERLVILIGIGLAVGVALTTLLAVLQSRIGGASASRSEMLQPASESPGR